jgi:hypothetical protein
MAGITGDGGLRASVPIASCQSSSAMPASSRHTGAVRLAPIAKPMCVS